MNSTAADEFSRSFHWFREFYKDLAALIVEISRRLLPKYKMSDKAPPFAPSYKPSEGSKALFRFPDPISVTFACGDEKNSVGPVPSLVTVLSKESLDDLEEKGKKKEKKKEKGKQGQARFLALTRILKWLADHGELQFAEPSLAVFAHDPLPHLCYFRLKPCAEAASGPRDGMFQGTLECEKDKCESNCKESAPKCDVAGTQERKEVRYRVFVVSLDEFSEGRIKNQDQLTETVQVRIVRPLKQILKDLDPATGQG